MSEPEPIPEEPEVVAGRPIAGTLGAVVLAIVVCGVVVWSLDAFDLTGGGRSGVVTIHSVPPAQPFSTETTPEIVRTGREIDLEHWTWANSAHDRVLLPVDLAIERYLAQRGTR